MALATNDVPDRVGACTSRAHVDGRGEPRALQASIAQDMRPTIVSAAAARGLTNDGGKRRGSRSDPVRRWNRRARSPHWPPWTGRVLGVDGDRSLPHDRAVERDSDSCALSVVRLAGAAAAQPSPRGGADHAAVPDDHRRPGDVARFRPDRRHRLADHPIRPRETVIPLPPDP